VLTFDKPSFNKLFVESSVATHSANGSARVGADALLEVVRQVATELHPSRALPAASLDARLDRDYGYDSLGRVELFLRIERQLGVSLSESVMASAETARDLLRAIDAAGTETRGPQSERVEALERETETPESASNLLEVLEWHVSRHPDRAHVVLQDEGGDEQTMTYAMLDAAARAVAVGLMDRGLQPGTSVAIMLPTSLEYFSAFMGILAAGGVPVPIYPPARPSQIEDHLRRHAAILTNARVEILVTVQQAKAIALLMQSQVASLKHVVTSRELAQEGQTTTVYRPAPQDTALLQYTSGSTGTPKGVIVSHANVLTNLRAMARALRATPNDVFVSWLPLYHDMGLIGAWLGSLTFGFKLPLMSPLTFLSRPDRWLWAIHRHRGTLSGGPNFCYELCLRRADDSQLEGLDLSSWRAAFNGAEPVSPETMAAFTKRFARYGFKPEAMTPVYGLAESTLGVAFTPVGRGPRLDRVDRTTFSRTGRAVPVSESHAEALTFVACGHPFSGHQVRIVDNNNLEVGERHEGRVQFSGPSSTSGYHRNPEETQRLLRGDWLETGDYGYIADGELYITGREKDVIIRAGRNIYPYELEEAVGNLEGIRKGCVAVFGSRDERSGTEKIVVLAETRATDSSERERLTARINELADTILGMPVDDVVLAPPQSVLKTSSGKLRRAASRELYEHGTGSGSRAVWLQILRLSWSSILPQARKTLRAGADLLYSAYVTLLIGVVGIVTWTVCAILPRTDWCWTATHYMARLFLRLAGMRLTVRGAEQLPREGPVVLASNHASYLDGLVLAAAIRRPSRFIAKSELLDLWVPRIYLTRLGAVFADRFDVQRGIEDAAKFTESLRQGDLLIVFPEGTIRRMPGLLPFRMGAFVIAARAGAALVPMVLRGTRSALRDGQWLFRRSLISVTFCAPITPSGTDWNSATELRNTARAEILRLCGEPDLIDETVLPPAKT